MPQGATPGDHRDELADPDISPEALKRRLDAGEALLLVDVRDPDEYEEWHLQGAVNIPLSEIERGAFVPVGARHTIVTICGYGNRSREARTILAERGERALHLAGGMHAYTRVYDAAPVPSTPEAVEVLQLRREARGCVSYLVVSDGHALVIDPTIDADVFLEHAKRANAQLTVIADTHAHADHVSGGPLLAHRVAAEYIGPAEAARTDATVRPGEALAVGAVELEVLATPGHTPGSLSYRLGDLLFTGDTLFLDGVGRPDLGQDPRENGELLWRTLHERILQLPADTRVLPGHLSGSTRIEPGVAATATIADLETSVEALSMGRSRFLEMIEASTLASPDNFEQIKAHNTGREEIGSVEVMRELETGPNRCAVSS